MATDLAVTVEDKPGALAGMGEAIGAATERSQGILLGRGYRPQADHAR